jgi:RNA polymerase sigma-70 factor (ECF subfamily)
VLEGDVRAFADLVNRHKARAMTLAMRILKNREDAEEALQDAFMRVYRSLPSFEWKSGFSTWFYRIVYNVCVSAVERRINAHIISLNYEDETEITIDIASDELPSDLRLESDEFFRIVQEEVEKLPIVYGSTFTLFVIQEMSYEEIAKVVNSPIGTVKARLFRARAALRTAIARRIDRSVIANEGEKVI